MDVFSIFLNMKICCVFSLETPHQGDFNEYTQYTSFGIKKENHPELFQICCSGKSPSGDLSPFAWLINFKFLAMPL